MYFVALFQYCWEHCEAQCTYTSLYHVRLSVLQTISSSAIQPRAYMATAKKVCPLLKQGKKTKVVASKIPWKIRIQQYGWNKGSYRGIWSDKEGLGVVPVNEQGRQAS